MKRTALLVISGMIMGFAAPASAAPTTSIPTGYRLITQIFNAAPLTQFTGTVRCPRGLKVVGGGANAPEFSGNLGENINSSVPTGDGRGWRAGVDNATGDEVSFAVSVLCVSGLHQYAIGTSAPVDNPPGTVSHAEITCPSGTVVFGGGGAASSGGTAANLVRSLPDGQTSWRVDAGNASTEDGSVTAVAVCAQKIPGYQQISGTPTGVAPRHSVLTTVQCPEGLAAFGGGADSTSGSPLATLHATIPGGSGMWGVAQNNASTTRDRIQPFVVCGAVH